VAPQPSATGATTPNTATRSAEGPTRARARRSDEPDLEEQQQHADLGQNTQGGIGLEQLGAMTADDERHEIAEAHAHQQLAKNRWLSQALDHETADLRRGHEQGNGEESPPDPAALARGRPRR